MEYLKREAKLPAWYLDRYSLYVVYREQRNKVNVTLKYYPNLTIAPEDVNYFKGLEKPDGRSKAATKGKTRDSRINAEMTKIENAVISVITKNDPFGMSNKLFIQLVEQQLEIKGSRYQTNLYAYAHAMLPKEKDTRSKKDNIFYYTLEILEKHFPNLSFEQITPNFLNDFVKILHNKPYSDSYTFQVVNTLLRIVSKAQIEKQHFNTQYIGWKRPAQPDVSNVFLTASEIESIYDLTLDLTGDLEMDYKKYVNDQNAFEGVYKRRGRDGNIHELVFKKREKMLQYRLDEAMQNLRDCRVLFLVGCWTGLRSGNYLHLNTKSVVSQDGRSLCIETVKTKEVVSIPLHRIARELLPEAKKIAKRISKNNNVFNVAVRKLGKLAGITQDVIFQEFIGGKIFSQVYPKHELLSSHTARRSFCSNLLIAGIPKQTIMAFSGHSKEDTFDKYTSNVKKQQLLESVYNHPMFA